jgi:hypothetical protein
MSTLTIYIILISFDVFILLVVRRLFYALQTQTASTSLIAIQMWIDKLAQGRSDQHRSQAWKVIYDHLDVVKATRPDTLSELMTEIDELRKVYPWTHAEQEQPT